MALSKPMNARLDPKWEKAADDIFMQFNLLSGYDRPLLMNWVASALKDAYEQGRDGKEYTVPTQTPAVTPPKRLVRPQVTVVEESPVTRITRRRT